MTINRLFAVFFKFLNFWQKSQKSTFGKKNKLLWHLWYFSVFFCLYKLVQACASLCKLKKVLCMFTDARIADDVNGDPSSTAWDDLPRSNNSCAMLDRLGSSGITVVCLFGGFPNGDRFKLSFLSCEAARASEIQTPMWWSLLTGVIPQSHGGTWRTAPNTPESRPAFTGAEDVWCSLKAYGTRA